MEPLTVTEPSLTDLDDEVKGLARERVRLAELEAELAERRKAFDIENEKLLSALAEKRELVAQYDRNVRDMAYFLAENLEEMRPHPAILVKRIRVTTYDPAEAVTWAIRHNMPDMIDLKKRAYEKALLSGVASDMPGEVNDDFQVTIKTDLSEWA